MLVREGDERGEAVDLRLACTLAAVAGALNTAVFRAVGFFAANMTGNVSSLSDRLASGDLELAAAFLSIVLAFIGGAAVSTLLVDAGRRRRQRGVYAFIILVEAVLLGLLGCGELWLPPIVRGPLLVVGVSFLMGLQNAVATRISGARVRTTHVSGMSTDIGIALGTLIDVARGREPRASAEGDRARLGLHAITLVSFCAGGVAGAILYGALGAAMLLLVAALLLILALNAIVRVRRLIATQSRPLTASR